MARVAVAIIDAARAESEAQLAAALEALAAERTQAEAQIESMANALAGGMTERVLGRTVAAG